MTSTVEYEDRWGEIIDRPGRDCIEIRWFDATSALDGDGFNEWIATFADHVERAGRANVLVDTLAFRMAMDRMDAAWRDANIIPRYNAAGVRKFAFLVPVGAPPIGAAPAPEGPATFPTAYFGTREDAYRWFEG